MKSSPSNNLKEFDKHKFGGELYDIIQAVWFGGYCVGSAKENKTQFKTMQRPDGIAAVLDWKNKEVNLILDTILASPEMQPSPMPNSPDDLDKGRNFGQNETKSDLRAMLEGLRK